MAAAAARLCGVEIARVQSNVRTNSCIGLKNRTEKDENKVSWTDWSFYLRLRSMQTITVFFAACLLNHLLSSSPVIPSILKSQLRIVEQQNKDRTAHHGTASAYDFSRALLYRSRNIK